MGSVREKKSSIPTLPSELKIVVMGSKEANKDSFIMKFLSSMDPDTEQSNKLGSLISAKRKLKTDTGEYLVEAVDCPEPIFNDRMITEEVRNAHGFVLMYSLLSRPSFEALKLCRGFINRTRGGSHVASVVVGSLPYNQTAARIVVNQKEAKELAASFEAPHIELMLSISPDQSTEWDQAHQVQQTFVILIKEMARSSPAKTSPTNSRLDRYSRIDTSEIHFVNEEKEKENEPPAIKEATLQKLIERATYDKYPSPDLVDDLIITYKAFTTPQELVKQMIKRYNIMPHKQLKDSEKAAWISQTQKPVRLRVISFFKSWIEDHPGDFTANQDVTQTLINFINMTVKNEYKDQAESLFRLIKRQTEGGQDAYKKTSPVTPPTPRVKKNKCDSLMDISGLECARQISLKDHSMYRDIRPLHCLKGKFSKDSAQDNSISALIQQFNMTSSFMMCQILGENRVKMRGKLVEKVIQIAWKCKELNNFSAVMMTLAALENTAIYRLKETWKLVNKKRRDQFLELRQLTACKGNYAAIRRAVASASQPLVPYLGVYLSMLIFIEDGNLDYSPEGLINWDKWRMAAQVIKDVRQYQQTTYTFERIEFIANFLYANNKEGPLSEEEAYRRSYQLEPGRVPIPITEATQEVITPREQKGNVLSPNTSARWAVGRVAEKSTCDESRAAPILARREQGVDDARQSLSQLTTATGDALAALIIDWAAKTRLASVVVHDTFANLQTIIPPSGPVLTEEERSYNVHYTSVLTGSKALEGVIGKLLSGSIPPSTTPTVYEWACNMMVGTATFTRQVIDAALNLAKLNPPAELIQPIADAICAIKIPSLDAKNVLKRRSICDSIVEHALPSQDPNSSSRAAHIVSNLDAILRLTVTRDGCPKSVESKANKVALTDAIEKLKGKELPNKSEILRAVAEVLSLVTKEYQRIKPIAEFGLMGNWEMHIRTCFFAYVYSSLKYCELLRDQMAIHHKRLAKMNQLARENNVSLMSLGIGPSEIKEQHRRDMSCVRKLSQAADEHEASSNHLIEWLLDNQYLSMDALRMVDASVVQQVSRCFIELKGLQRLTEGEADGGSVSSSSGDGSDSFLVVQ